MKGIISTSGAFLFLFIAVRHIAPQGILFYQGMALALMASLSHLFVMSGLRGRSVADAAKDSLLVFLLFYGFVLTVPTTVDRAYTVRMLARLARDPGGLDSAAIHQWYVSDFVEHGAVQKRLEEQTLTGTIEFQEGRFRLTPFGWFLERTFELTRAVFACGDRRS